MSKYLIILVIAGFTFNSHAQIGKIKFKSGNFSGIDYISISKKEKGKLQYTLWIECNHYIHDLGKIPFVRKTTYLNGKYNGTYHLISDSVMFSKMNYYVSTHPAFIKLNQEELNLIQEASKKYNALNNKYKLDTIQFPNSFGWYKATN